LVTLSIEPPQDIYAPPGYYMLFVIDRNGQALLPSAGEFIQLLQ
jgi:hypothetical protein